MAGASENLLTLIGLVGVTELARRMGISPDTVQAWRQRGVVPQARAEALRLAALRYTLELAELLLADQDDPVDD
jgi:DNA-binding transcriptional MerR regulator